MSGSQDGSKDQASFPTEEEKLWRTHHETGSAEERYSRTMRFDKYLAMQQLLAVIVQSAKGTEISEPLASTSSGRSIADRARDILAGMVRPRGPGMRAQERMAELEALAFAYRVAGNVLEGEGPTALRAATITVEALKAWERAHPPAPLDPLLL